MRALLYFVAGLLFSLGLVISGMTQPSKVVGFLDFFGQWDPSLALVMGGAILAHFPAYRLMSGRKSPLLADSFYVPSSRRIDAKLVLGSALFGVGWGLGGYCPGPAITSLVALHVDTVLFVVSMAVAMLGYGWVRTHIAAFREDAASKTAEAQ